MIVVDMSIVELLAYPPSPSDSLRAFNNLTYNRSDRLEQIVEYIA